MILVAEHVLVVLGVLAVALAMILALQQRRTPQSAAAWVLFIVLVPYVAVPVFLLLGFRRPRRHFPPIRFSAAPGVPDSVHPLAAMFRALGAPAATGGNALALHDDPAEARAALDALIDGAARRIDVMLYIVADDDSGRAFLSRLADRAASGVEVRLALDWLGSLRRRPRAALRALRAAGAEVRFFSPLQHLTARGGLNLRNHRKLVIADDAAVWAGGRNVADAYFTPGPGAWADLSFVLRGPAVQGFVDVFASDWEMTGAPRPAPLPARHPPAGQREVQIVPAGPDEPLDLLHDGLVNAIHRATGRVWIATPYFLPTEALSQALITAVRRGVEVRILLPDRSNQWTADLARGAYLREAAAAGCRVQRHPGMMHAKAGLIDDAAWVGSANFDVRSMQLNFELALMVYDAATVAALERWFERLGECCAEGHVAPGLPRRLLEGIFRLGAPIL